MMEIRSEPVDYNRYRITYNHPEVGRGQIVAEHPELVKIGGLVIFDLTESVYLHDYVEISTGVQIFTHKHLWNHSRGLRKDIQAVVPYPLVVNRDAFIGVSAIILGGVQYIGEGAVIGAGAVVTKFVPDFEVWAGNPARKIGERG
jgi:acetyltransferase-like isoleucine patch superfamily enzyme